MTQKERELIWRDLSARLPYGGFVQFEVDGHKTIKPLTLDFLSSTWYHTEFIKPYLRPISSMTEEEKKEYENCYQSDDTTTATLLVDFYNKKHFDYRGLIEKGLALEAPKGMYPEPKWLYRLEYKDDTNGLWYNGNGNWCFEKGIGSIEGCKTKTLPMDYDERYKQDGRDWFSSCSKKEDLLHWYSLEDAKKLLDNGFVFTRYLATEYHEYDLETVFIKETSINREVLDIFDLFKDN